MPRRLYRCWRCLGRHYANSARGAQCQRFPAGPTAVAAVILTGLTLSAVKPGFLDFGRDDPAPTGARTTVTVTRTIDGDTIEIRTSKNRSKRVRILGINTPEVTRAGKPGECYADEATDALRNLIGLEHQDAPVDGDVGARVELIRDPTQDNKDVYGRLLRYVEIDGRDVGATLIRRGAAYARDDRPPVQRAERYDDLEADARDANRGLWAACS